MNYADEVFADVFNELSRRLRQGLDVGADSIRVFIFLSLILIRRISPMNVKFLIKQHFGGTDC